MGMEQSNSINYLSESVRKSTLEKQLDFQEATRPNISEEYYTPAIDFMARFYVSEYYTGLNYEVFPEEFRDYVNTVPRNTILGNGAIKVAVIKIANAEKKSHSNTETKQVPSSGPSTITTQILTSSQGSASPSHKTVGEYERYLGI